jgi:hypothetical protein
MSAFRLDVATMRTVWLDVFGTTFGVALIANGLRIGMPAWSMALLGFMTGTQAVFALTAYRDVLRHRIGLLHDFNTPRP